MMLVPICINIIPIVAGMLTPYLVLILIPNGRTMGCGDYTYHIGSYRPTIGWLRNCIDFAAIALLCVYILAGVLSVIISMLYSEFIVAILYSVITLSISLSLAVGKFTIIIYLTNNIITESAAYTDITYDYKYNGRECAAGHGVKLYTVLGDVFPSYHLAMRALFVGYLLVITLITLADIVYIFTLLSMLL